MASEKKKFPTLASWLGQDGGVTAPRAGRGRPGWPMAAHQLASAYRNSLNETTYQGPPTFWDQGNVGGHFRSLALPPKSLTTG